MKHFMLLITTFLIYSCSKPCEVCEVIKNGEVIEKYESCDEEGIKASRSICDEMAKMQNCECKCRATDAPEAIQTTKENNLMKTVDEVKQHVEHSFSKNEETLLIADELNDQMGLNMALIGDIILKKGYMPTGFEQKQGYRIYKYTKKF